ncbi:MAG: tetratricopeptide repeat protein [Bacteroidota bacterium]
MLYTPFISYGQGLSNRDEQAIQRQAKFIVEEYQKLLVNLSNQSNTPAIVEKIIYNNIYGDRIFWNERVTIEDDLDPTFANYRFPQDKSVEDYLNDFDIYYKKKYTGTIIFDNLRVTGVQRSVEGYWFVKVSFQSRFLNNHIDIPLPYPARDRVAEIRAEPRDVGWNTFIMSVSYYDKFQDRDQYKEFDFLPEVIQANSQKLRQDSYVWISRGEYKRALNLLERAYALSPTQEVEASIRSMKEQLAGIETRSQYFSVDSYTDFIKANPAIADPYVGRGRKYLQLGDYANALADFQKALDIKPNYLKAHLYEAETHLKASQLDSAMNSFETAISITPEDIPLNIRVAELYFMQGRYPAMRKVLDNAISRSPEVPKLYNLRSKLNFSVRRYESTVEDLRILTYLEKDSLHFLQALGSTYKLLGSSLQADSCFALVKQKVPAYARALTLQLQKKYDLADRLFNEEQYVESVHVLNDRIMLGGLQPMDLLLRGKASLQAGFTTFALEDFTDLLDFDASAEVYYLRALAAQKLGNISAAKKDLTEAINRDEYLCDAYLLLAKIYDEEDDYSEAVSHYKQALRCKPNQPQYHIDLAELHYKNEAYEDAESSARDALIFDPQFASAYLLIGRAQIQRERFRDAELQYLKFLKYGEEDPEVYLELADFYEKYYGMAKRAEKYRKKASRN